MAIRTEGEETMSNQMYELAVAANKIAELAHVLGVRNIKAFPGAWYRRIDDKWEVATNGHDKPIDVEPPGCMKATIDPYHTAVWYNGWLAGLMTPFGGIIAAGEGANEDTFIAALDKAIAGVKQRDAGRAT